MMGNYDQHSYAIDNFSQFQGPKREFQSNVQRYGFSETLNFLEGDCFEIFRAKFLGSQKVGVYFYDGDHSTSFEAENVLLQLTNERVKFRCGLLTKHALPAEKQTVRRQN
jgi:hypothetical protein